jgi:D-psicose/D-tagatose/L-ribulose 3-epimerase
MPLIVDRVNAMTWQNRSASVRFGISTWFWAWHFATQNIDLVDRAARLGFDWIEIPLDAADQFDYRRVGGAIRDHGMGVSAGVLFDDACDFTVDNAAKNRAGVEWVRQCVDATVALGGHLLGGVIYSSYGRSWRDDDRPGSLKRAARHLKEVGRYAADRGVVVALEPLNRFETSFLLTMEQALELIDMVNDPAVQILADTFHMNIEEKNIPQALASLGKHLVHVHADENDRGVPGTGHVDWLGVKAALQSIGYDGALIIEPFDVRSQGIAEASRTWRPVVRDDEALADGLTFLRGLFAG